jgi:hypothetical protein
MNKSASILATAVTGLGLIAAGLVSIPSQGNAGVAATNAADRVAGAFALLGEVNFTASEMAAQASGPWRSAIRQI